MEKGATGVIVAIIILILIALGGLFYLSQKGSGTEEPLPPTENSGATTTQEATITVPGENIFETISSVPNLTTLVKALEAAGLTNLLSSTSTVTLFAPTDEAFAKIPKKDLVKLLADKVKLAKVLNYHLVKGDLSLNNITATTTTGNVISTISALEGGILTISTGPETASVENAKIKDPAIKARNGAVFLIDTVLMPK